MFIEAMSEKVLWDFIPYHISFIYICQWITYRISMYFSAVVCVKDIRLSVISHLLMAVSVVWYMSTKCGLEPADNCSPFTTEPQCMSSDKTCYREISWKFEVTRYLLCVLKSLEFGSHIHKNAVKQYVGFHDDLGTHSVAWSRCI